MKRHTLWCSALAAAAFLVTTASLSHAAKQWSCWHWDHNVIGASNFAGGYWGTINNSELNDWDAGTCVDFSSGTEIMVDAGFYGATGWLGIAQILQYNPDCTIVQAQALMNQSYLDGGSYGETSDRHVCCQEIGHTLGLDHVKGPKAKSCMNDQTLGFPDFNQADADLIAAITGGCSGGGGGGAGCAGGNEKGPKKCTDGIDNDGDGCIDADDPDCN